MGDRGPQGRIFVDIVFLIVLSFFTLLKPINPPGHVTGECEMIAPVNYNRQGFELNCYMHLLITITSDFKQYYFTTFTTL